MLLESIFIPSGYHTFSVVEPTTIGFFVPNTTPHPPNRLPPNLISIYYQNVRGLRSKTSSVFLNSHKLPFDIFALTETNLSADINDNELFPSHFNIFRVDGSSDDAESCGRGVLLAIHNSYDSTLYKTSLSTSFEFVCVKSIISKYSLFIICCYLRPSQPTQCYQLAIDAFDSIFDAADSSDVVIIFGDFNLPNLQWVLSEEESYYIALNPTSEKEVLFTDCLSDLDLYQLSGVKNNLGRQLDLIFSSDVDNCVVSASDHLLSKLDYYHPPLCLTFSYDFSHKANFSENPLTFNFRKANFPKLNSLLRSVDFNSITHTTDIDIALSNFYSNVFNCLTQSVPVVKQKSTSSSPPWYNSDLRSLRNKRNKLWRIYLTSRSDFDLLNYQNTNSLFSELCDALYQDYLNRMQSCIITDPKRFFHFINAKRKSDSYPSTLNYLNSSSDDPQIVANFFAQFFRQSFSDTDLQPDLEYFAYLKSCTQTSLNSIRISTGIVEDKINNLKDDYSAGPDGVPAIILKKCCLHLAKPLTALFQLSLSLGVFPSVWKNSFIIPIHKKGPKKEISNYRPIAKLSCIPKLFESIVYDTMLFHCKQIVSPNQHGFVKGRSTTTNLIEFVSRTLCSLENGNEVDVIATDLSKAFDKISHSLILFKLNALGFQPIFISWIESYLKDRQYRVIFRSSESDPILATSGVPQGSHLGPLIFILTINDVDCIIKDSFISVYADDKKIFRHISSPADSLLLQNDLNKFSTWCLKNFLELNVNKCQAITYSRKRFQLPPRTYLIDNVPVPSVDSLCDLGIICDRELNFRSHIDTSIKRANSALGFVKRWSKEFSDPYVTKSLYTTFVRPLLEYASQVWSPSYLSHSQRIEAVQRRFLRFALRGLPWSDPHILPPYEHRLKLINMESLEYRRRVADVVFTHQLLAGNIDCPSLLQKISLQTNFNNLRSIPLFQIKFHRTNYGCNEPMTRMLRTSNSVANLFDFHLSKDSLKTSLYRTS